MERAPIITQYHQLREYLNRANKVANQKMEVEFMIEEFAPSQYRLLAISKNEHESHRIALTERGRNKTWERTGFTPFQQFEEFCALLLNDGEGILGKKLKCAKLTPEDISDLQRTVYEKVKMLLVGKGYEP